MSINRRLVQATPEQVWAVLSDGWLYPTWVVGATRMRAVDDTWPDEGARLHHSAGVWPVVINDSTQVLASVPARELRLRARGWPAGEAEVRMTLDAQGAATDVTLEEKVVAGPARLVPDVLEAALMKWRNTETLRRLAFIAERRSDNGG